MGSLYGRPAAELEDHRTYGLGQRAVKRTSTGTLMATATEAFGDTGYVEFPLAAQANAVAAIGQLAEESRHFDAADRKHVVHQAFTVLFQGIAAFHLFARDPEIADMVVQIEIAERLAQ